MILVINKFIILIMTEQKNKKIVLVTLMFYKS